jgi:hypothetical protein
MSLSGKWRIVAMPDYVEDYPDMLEPAYLLFEENGSGEFAFGCVTGQIFGGRAGNSVEFSWQGNDEMDEVQGDGRAELQPDGPSRVQSASITATKPTSPLAAGLLQQPDRP